MNIVMQTSHGLPNNIMTIEIILKLFLEYGKVRLVCNDLCKYML